MSSHSALRSGLAPQSRTALGITVTCDDIVKYEGTKDSTAAADDEDDGCVNADYDHDAYDNSYLTCIDSEPVKHLCQLASLLLKLICLQLQR